jgi:ribonuclease III
MMGEPMITSNEPLGLEERLRFQFQRPELLRQALTHKSYFNEHPLESAGHNETFEFLGDAVLDLSLGHLLMRTFPKDDEGRLSKKRASLVNESNLSLLASELGLEHVLFLGRGEKGSGGSKKPRLLASAFEAVIGAVFLDQGFEAAERVIANLFVERIEGRDWTEDFAQDFKTRLQERIQSSHGQTPSYVLLSESGPDHEKQFEVEVRVAEQLLGSGRGSNKKQAEQDAAKHALTRLNEPQIQEDL